MAGLFDDDPHVGGYDCQFVSPEDPPPYLLCLICFSVAKSPQQMDCCGKLYCEECLAVHKKFSTKCPHCRKAGRSFNDKRGERDILALKVKCNNNEQGCQWTGELRSLNEHITSKCNYTWIQCPNYCSARFIRTCLKSHVEWNCPKRQYSCPNCGQKGLYDKITTEHLQQCPNVTVKCANQGCSFTCRRKNLKSHTCLYEQVPCKYSDIGCREKQIRKHIEAHEQDGIHHLHLTKEMVIQLKQEVAVLKVENENLVNEIKENWAAFRRSKKADVKLLYEHIQLNKKQLAQEQALLKEESRMLKENKEAILDCQKNIGKLNQHIQRNKVQYTNNILFIYIFFICVILLYLH